MKVLIIHNFYRSLSPSGEDRVFEEEAVLLRENGVQIVIYEKSNDEIKGFGEKLSAIFKISWSKESYREVKQLIEKHRPDLVHVHNFWYLISPSIFFACNDLNVPVVQTVHNYRMFCANGLLLRNNAPCNLCVGKKPWRGAAYGCYKNSRIYSLPIVISQYLHQIIKTWDNKVNAFIVPSVFLKNKLIESGLTKEKIFVKPHFTEEKKYTKEKPQNSGVFIGRISAEKGMETLVNAVMKLRESEIKDFSITLVGEGPAMPSLAKKVKEGKVSGLRFLDKLSHEESMKVLKRSRFLVIPSICYETFSKVAIEAFSCGKPVIASKSGALQDIVFDRKTGFIVKPNDYCDLASKMASLTKNDALCAKMGEHALAEYYEKYTAINNYKQLMEIYSYVIEGSKN
jgi:glycosyltransferase involved in cell wall biosynthesis